MDNGSSFQILDPKKQTNAPPEGVKNATETCWFCLYNPPRTRPDCPKCNSCFLPTKDRIDGTEIVWYIGYFDNLQTPEEKEIVLDKLAKEFRIYTTNVAVCCRDQESGLLVVLRQLNGKREFSVQKDNKVVKMLGGKTIEIGIN